MRKLVKLLLVAIPAACLTVATGPDGHEPPHKPAPAKTPVVKAPAVKDLTTKDPAAKQPAPKPAPAPEADAHGAASPATDDSSQGGDEINAERALTLLREGNDRWAVGNAAAPNTKADRRELLADKGQHPFVTIIACSDSRVPVERVFDRGIGDLFVVRVAGNRAGDSESGTVEYGVEHLKTPLLLVMGHTKCGAVAAAAAGTPLHGKVAGLVRGIEPAIERARRQNPGLDDAALAPIAVKENVWQTVFDLYKSSATVREAVAKGELKVVGAVYDIATGKVEWMGEHPWQKELISAIAPAEAKQATAPAHP